MVWSEIPTVSVEREAIVDEELMKNHLKNNDDDHESRILSLEAAGGGGSGGVQDTGAIGEIVLGGETNEVIYWKRRFHPLQHMLNADSENPSGFDPEGKSLKNELLTFIQSNDLGLSLGVSSITYLGQYLIMAKSSSISFKIKKGINFFSIGSFLSTGSNNMEVRIDGQTPSSIGLVDENGNAAADFYSENSATNFAQRAVFYYGLDGNEHVVTITNNDSGTQISRTEFIEVGYRSENPTIDESVNIKAGKALVRGGQVNFNEADVTFSKLDKNGHTGAIVCSNTGTITALDGESPAMTQVKAEEAIAFSGTVTTLPVKNNFYFPSNGICILSTGYGTHHPFSYSSKTDTLIQSHSLDGIIWKSKPSVDMVALNNDGTTTYDATLDLNINYWGTAPIAITTVNNKLDFAVTIAGVRTTHTATITSGNYAADIVSIGDAISNAMKAVKPINGSYNVKYNQATQLWIIYVGSFEVEDFELLFSTGVSFVNSIHATLGFASTDLSGKLSYLATAEKQHLSCRVFQKDAVYMHVEDPRIKYSATNQTGATPTEYKDIKERLNLGNVRFMNTAMIQIHVDDDCCGISLDFIPSTYSKSVTAQIDDGQCIYLTNLYSNEHNSTGVRGSIRSGFLSFPRGSKKITLRNETSAAFSPTGSDVIIFAGARQYFTKPAYEKLTKQQSILKTFDIAPISLYATTYGHNGGVVYSPNASNDNVNTITENSFGGAPWTILFNGAQRSTSLSGGYQEIDFTLVGDGGGISFNCHMDTGYSFKAQLLISQSVINTATDKIQNHVFNWGYQYPDSKAVMHLGLKAGTYKARLLNVVTGSANGILTSGFTIYDTVPPQENANTVNDILNTGQSICYPINVKRMLVQQDSNNIVPTYLQRSGYNEGKVAMVNYAVNTPTHGNTDDAIDLITGAEAYYSSSTSDGVIDAKYSFNMFAKSISFLTQCFTSYSATISTFIDSVSALSTFSEAVQVKGGTAPSTARSSMMRLFQKQFELSCSHSAGLVFLVNDTRGFKNDMLVILDDGVNKEKAVITSFVVGVSFTIKKALTTVIAANVTKVYFYGFHNIEIKNGSVAPFFGNCFEYEPLTISPSKAIQRLNTRFKYEKVGVTFREIGDGADLYYPSHSDGIAGNYTTSTISVISTNANYYNITQDLKNIGVNLSTIDVQISSERLVPVLDEQERF